MKILRTLLLFLLIGCAQEPYKLVEQSMKLIEENSIKKDEIDWETYSPKYIEYAEKNNTTEIAHYLIKKALINLEDGHSMFVSKELYDQYFSSKAKVEIPTIDSMLIDDKYGYIKIPSFLSQDKKAGKQFALAIQEEIHKLDNQNIQGWIIDLSENSGGNMWPMLAGLSPLIENGTLGYFYKGNDKYISWSIKGNRLIEGKKKMNKTFNKTELHHKNQKIAVIIGEKTGSSGEAVAISLQAQKNTKFFGQPTYGSTTGNSVFKIKDGSRLAIASSIMSNSNKEIINGKILPDVITDNPIEEIKTWIN